MKILKIELQNINSLKSTKPIVIDFESEIFQDVGLFAITGPTGSGKTTVLDAITIALYHQVPRFKQSNIKAGLEDVVSYGASEAMVRLTFENKRIRYEAFWHIRLTGSNGKRLNKAVETVRIKNLSEGKILGQKKKNVQIEIERITQLKYDQFLRSMMLAQGEFASFLSAKSKDKAALLEQITGEDIYKRIGEAIQQRIREETKKLEQVKAKINAEDILSPEEEIILNQENSQLKARLDDLAKEGQVNDRIRTWYKKKESVEDRLIKLEEDCILWQQEKEKKQTIFVALERHQIAEPFKEELTELKRLESDQQENIAKYEKLSHLLDSINKSIIVRQKAVDDTLTKVSLADENWSIWLPKLEKIYALDLTLESIKNHLLENKGQVEETKKKIAESQTEIKKKENQKERGILKQKELSYFLNQNKDIPLIEKKIREWAVQIANYKTEVQNLQKEEKSLQKKQEEHSILTNFIEKENTKKAIKQQHIFALNKELGKLNDNLRSLNFEAMLNSQIALNERKQELNRLYTISQEYENKSRRKALLIKEKTKSERLRESKEKELIQITKEIALASELIKETEKSLQQEIRIQSLEEERKRLIKGEACPLCGSTNHPAIEKYAKIAVSLSEKRLQERKERHKKRVAEKEAIAIFANQLNIEIKNYIAELETLDLLKIESQFVHPSLQITNAETIKQALAEIDDKIKNINKKSQDYSSLQEQKEKVNYSLMTHTKELHSIEDLLSQKKEALRILNERIEEGKLNILDAKKKNAKLTTLLQDELKQFKLSLPDLQKIDRFIPNIEKRVNDYQKKKQDLIKTENTLENLNLEIQNLQNQHSEKREIVYKLEKEIEKNKSRLEETTSERENILALSISPAQQRTKLQEEVKKTKRLNQEAQKNHIQIEKEKAIKEKELSIINTHLLHLKHEIEQKNKLLEKSIQDSSFDNRRQLESALLNKQTETSYQETKKQIEDKGLQLSSLRAQSIQERKLLTEKKDFTITEKEILEKERERKSKEQATIERIGEIRGKFQLDQQIKDRNKEVFKEIERQSLEWEKWKNLITLLGGSKDAFNTYVQRLTLQNLIQRANLHLIQLNPRYSLQMNSKYKAGEELNFHLIDHYQIDQTRLVETTSGGEKFLISLALALGLSDLASKNVNIESLFIDEGFGSLDQATLEVVIATLESLQSQGKRIGVISHVETLKNRISTQIQVSRKGNGISELMIV